MHQPTARRQPEPALHRRSEGPERIARRGRAGVAAVPGFGDAAGTWHEARLVRFGAPVLLAGSSLTAMLTASSFQRPAAAWVAAVALVVLVAGMHLQVVERRWGRPLDDRAGAAYVAVRSVAHFALAWINPFFAVAALAGYFDTTTYVAGRRAVAVYAVTALTMAGSQSGGFPPRSGVQALVVGGLLVLHLGLLTLFSRVDAQNVATARSRDATITDLEDANARLARALRENEALEAELVASARESGVHAERQRLALEIHDTIAQGLAGIVTQLQAADETADADAAARHRERAAALARDSLGEARRSLQGLLPRRLDEAALPDAVRELAEDWSTHTGVSCHVVVTGDPEPLHRDVESSVLRVVQEALTNVAKHADARRVGVTLSYMGDEVALDVRDDGVGFEPATDAAPGAGIGLRSMRRRTALVAGELDVESELGVGTAVSLRVPAVGRG